MIGAGILGGPVFHDGVAGNQGAQLFGFIVPETDRGHAAPPPGEAHGRQGPIHDEVLLIPGAVGVPGAVAALDGDIAHRFRLVFAQPVPGDMVFAAIIDGFAVGGPPFMGGVVVEGLAHLPGAVPADQLQAGINALRRQGGRHALAQSDVDGALVSRHDQVAVRGAELGMVVGHAVFRSVPLGKLAGGDLHCADVGAVGAVGRLDVHGKFLSIRGKGQVGAHGAAQMGGGLRALAAQIRQIKIR